MCGFSHIHTITHMLVFTQTHTRPFPRPENSRTWDRPSPLELVPASHEVHTPMLAPPDDVENVPAAHNVQSSPRPMAPELQVPGRHARH